ncbi:MAG: thiamine ABC transporter substrate-binding protein [Acidimicrobiia bacterium]|nr:thiamine ABC transporter substrate-binding protein [Acidimicrobiia bacterium]
MLSRPNTRHVRRGLPLLWAGALLLAACGGDDGAAEEANGGERPADEVVTVRLLTHESFNLPEDLLDDFEEESGIRIEVVAGGDAVTVVNQAVLTAGRPQADVLFGIDNNTLHVAFDADVFEPYEATDAAALREGLPLDPQHRATPIDVGDVCVNYDVEYFESNDLDVPVTLEDLADPGYGGLLAVQNPATSSPGLAFLLATIAAFGEEEAMAYWDTLVDNDVVVVDGWEQAYYGEFSGGSGEGTRPLVVSYASSPPAEVLFSEAYEATGELPEQAPTGVLAETCYRQVEYAGVLAGTEVPEAAGAVIDFLLSEAVQEAIPLSMFVEPVRSDVALPEVFEAFAVVVDDPWELPSAEVAAERERWVGEWRSVVLR